ncbi:aminotransferase class V-fold PLP-dependent enzyme [Nonomuraea rhodomycinica]|uniref:aminotransferase class V-fold PLP-dependent enzyme n=1 Tax=Nonomuraea rhodomycinica TaxID=1712872 RepID=UPI001C37C2A0|nr:aminotransferase class V-fold PLP-dependent enzyme [Nonomuraea rhodomycinica]
METTPIPGARELFSLDPEVIQLNHGSYGAVPVEVQERQAELRAEMERMPDRFFARLPARLAAARERVAAFLNSSGAAFVANATEGVAVALESVPLAAGDEILYTDHGYAAVERALRRRAGESGARLVRVALGDDPVTAVLGGVGARTRVAVLDHVSSAGARLLPVARLAGELAARDVVTVVDGAHASGMLPVDLDAVNADFWVGNLHKWAFAPRPAALLHVAPRWRGRVRPLVVSYGEGFPDAVEFQGTRDYTALLAAPYGLDLLERLGLERVRAHNTALAAYGQRVVAESLHEAGLCADAPGTREECSQTDVGHPGVPMRVVRLASGLGPTKAEADALCAEILDRLGCQIKIEPVGLLRLSAQIYNTPEDYDRLAAGLPAVLRSRRGLLRAI